MKISALLPARFRQRQVARTFGYHPRGVQPRLERGHIFKGAKFAVAALIGTAAVLGVHKLMCRSVFFQLTAIAIEGCRHTTKEQILALSGVDIHTNLLALQPARIKAAIEVEPWVDKARIVRKWPNQLLINIEEKKPLALINCKDGLYYLDRDGRVFAKVEPGGDLDFPVITGHVPPVPVAPATGPRKEPAPAAGLQEALFFLELAQGSNPILPRQNISELHITESGGLILYLLDQAFPIYLGRNDMRTKYNRLVKVLKGLYKKGEIADIAYIRVDYRPEEVLVGMTKSGERTRG